MKASGPTALRVCLDYLWFTGGVTTGSRVQLNWGSHPKHSMKSNSEWTVDINKDGWQIFTSYYCTGARAKIAKIQRLPSWHRDWICTPGTGWWSPGIPNSKHNLNKRKMYCRKWKKRGGRVCCDPYCSLPPGEWFMFCLSLRELSCPSISISSQWKEHAFWALGGGQLGDWRPSRKGDLQLVCGTLTSRHSRREKKKELSETLSNNDFYKISERGFILCKLNAKLRLTVFSPLLF